MKLKKKISDASNYTKTVCDSNQNFTINSQNNFQNNTEQHTIKKEKIFLIKKYIKYDEIINEFCGDEEAMLEKRSKIIRNPNEKKIKLIKSSKKLKDFEKIEKLKILSKVVRRYRRQLKNIKRKIKQKSEKSFQKYLNKNLSLKDKKKKSSKINFSMKNLIITMKKLQDSNNTLDYSEDRNALENLICLIGSGRIDFNSIHYKKICTQIRMFLKDGHIEHLKKNSNILVNLPEKNVYISKIELEFYKNAINDENIFRAILGLSDPVIKKETGLFTRTNQEVRSQTIYDPVLESLFNNTMIDCDEFCNNLFSNDQSSRNNVLIK